MAARCAVSDCVLCEQAAGHGSRRQAPEKLFTDSMVGEVYTGSSRKRQTGDSCPYAASAQTDMLAQADGRRVARHGSVELGHKESRQDAPSCQQRGASGAVGGLESENTRSSTKRLRERLGRRCAYAWDAARREKSRIEAELRVLGALVQLVEQERRLREDLAVFAVAVVVVATHSGLAAWRVERASLERTREAGRPQSRYRLGGEKGFVGSKAR